LKEGRKREFMRGEILFNVKRELRKSGVLKIEE